MDSRQHAGRCLVCYRSAAHGIAGRRRKRVSGARRAQYARRFGQGQGGGGEFPAAIGKVGRTGGGSEELRAFWKKRLRSFATKIRRHVGRRPTIQISLGGLRWAGMSLRKCDGARLPDRLKDASVEPCNRPQPVLAYSGSQISLPAKLSASFRGSATSWKPLFAGLRAIRPRSRRQIPLRESYPFR